ncbi:MAG: tRNA (N6-isopentenyl adenosine(37)-C2)-methylthiotransferase MiaB [Deltaproteobacteria bacterium]|nr:tRNA (N6-isopentenyl adenosine(37)-C2)-methylthiotransferase MiaB [Deltaproteobacteria bacterium]
MSFPSVYLKTFGCQMNVNDSQHMLNLLAAHGYVPTPTPDKADLLLVNTCSVREKSEQKFYSLLGRLISLRKSASVLLCVGGCVAQQEGEKLLERFPYVDVIFGTGSISRLPMLVEKARKTGKVQIDTSFEDEFLSVAGSNGSIASDIKAFLTIMKGCNNFCSFCVVPYVRGREKSRPSGEILREAEHLVGSGVKEITLLGQNVNSYGQTCSGEVTFPELLRKINGIPGLHRIRFTTSHPKDLSQDLIRCFGELEKLCPHLHLPLQSGSTRILKMMNRGYTREGYRDLIQRLRAVCPHIAITTDIIVGFPGETETDFQETVDIVHEIEYDEFYSFKYSDRPNTRASKSLTKVSDKEKARRLSLLQEVQKHITLRKNRRLVGNTAEVLVEGCSKTNAKRLTGRSGSNKVINFEGLPELRGKLVQVEITEAFLHSFLGRRV